ncbi:MAG: ribosome maturation factor RimP [Saccharofermentanales bacterium]|mgnify:FL=1|jgi:ribosome maturation factor RimP|nr:ribosome maturation factor RimP [Bacillota bacterium]
MAKRTAEEQRIFDRLISVAESLDLELIEVKYRHEGSKLFLTVFVDRRGGVTIDECGKMSELADPIIDDELGLKRHDYFEVSSPGLDRPLTEIADFVRYAGEFVSLKLYGSADGKKNWQGLLVSGDEQEIVLNIESEEKSFPRKGIAVIKREVVF